MEIKGAGENTFFVLGTCFSCVNGYFEVRLSLFLLGSFSALSDANLIPRQAFFGNPDRAGVKFSPDGKWISYIAPFEGVLNLWIAPRGHLDQARPLTQETGRGIRHYDWAYTNQHLLYLKDQDGDENWVIYRIDVETAESIPLTPEKGVHARLTKVSPTIQEEIVVSLNDRSPEYHDLYRLNIITGDKDLLLENQEYLGFILDDDYHVHFALKGLPDGGRLYLSCQGADPSQWSPFLTVDPEDVMTTALLGFNQDQTALYLLDSRQRNTSAFVEMDLKTQQITVLSENDQADIDDLLGHPRDKKPLAVASNYDRKSWTFFDQDVQRDFEKLASLQDGDVEVVSQTYDNNHWIVAFIRDNGPVAYYDYDRSRQEASFLFTNRQALENLPLHKMHPVFITSRDGLTLVSYLTLPRTCDPEQTGTPSRPVPLVLDVHGGPRVRDSWSYNPVHQWLANRGYAVLSVNYRGSTGFGKDFMNAGNGEWGRKMQDDLLDAKAWAVAQGMTQEDTVCIFGGSYGGYATLAGLSMTPEAFACGVDIVGPSNLITLANSVPPYWRPIKETLIAMLGADPETEEGQAFLKERSPLSYHQNIKKPLLIAQGANDPRVAKAESDQIVEALKSKEIPVTYALYPDEGHGFARPENRLSFYGVMESFLSQHLGGASQPLGEDGHASSIQLLEGEHLVN